MISRITIFATLLFFISCAQKNKFPAYVSEKVEMGNVNLTSSLPVFSGSATNNSKIDGLNKLDVFQNQYLKENLEFNLDEFQMLWNQIKKEIDFVIASHDDLKKWFEVSGFLFELTGEAVYAEELEKIVLLGIGETIEENKKIISPYVFTKNLDNLFVNVFTPSTINYKHTTKGEVEVTQETNYPWSGKVELKFRMTERRYIEVNIRIPSWADGATVTVKKVKYIAPPGGYCKIAKKWKEGDLVEIEFPIKKKPENLSLRN